MKKRVLLIVNPKAGRLRSRKKVSDIVAALADPNWEITVRETTGRGHAQQLTAGNGAHYDLIICCGGDGTFNEVINGMVQLEHNVPLAYIPNGTTNDTAKTLSLPRSLPELARLIKKGHFHKCDIGQFNGRHFFCAVSFGFGAKASFTTKQSMKNKIGRFAYIISGVKNVPDVHPIPMEITYDGQQLSGEFVFGAVINTKSVGGIFTMDDQTFRINDGKFELVLVRKLNNLLQLPAVLLKLQQHDYDGSQVILIQANTITFRSPSPVPWLIDGEDGGEQTRVQVKNLAEEITICAPQSGIF